MRSPRSPSLFAIPMVVVVFLLLLSPPEGVPSCVFFLNLHVFAQKQQMVSQRGARAFVCPIDVDDSANLGKYQQILRPPCLCAKLIYQKQHSPPLGQKQLVALCCRVSFNGRTFSCLKARQLHDWSAKRPSFVINLQISSPKSKVCPLCGRFLPLSAIGAYTRAIPHKVTLICTQWSHCGAQ